MIQLVEGAPGSGKSYFAMNYLVGFTKFDELYNEYVLREDVLVITNIEGLKIKHWELSACLKDRSLTEFFSIKNFEEIQKRTKKTHIILIIDEVHELFPSGFKDMQIYNFFAYHRHIGLDIILLTQGIDAMTRMLNPLLEYVVKATPRSKKLTKSFTYKYCDMKGRYLFNKIIPTKQKVFNAYQSFRQDEHNKPRSAVVMWLALVICVFVAAGTGLKYSLGRVGANRKAAAIATTNSVNNNTPVVAAGMSAPVNDTSDNKYLPWTTYPVEGWVKIQSGVYLLINGRSLKMDARFRNYDPVSKTVEYFGKPISRLEYRPRDNEAEKL